MKDLKMDMEDDLHAQAWAKSSARNDLPKHVPRDQSSSYGNFIIPGNQHKWGDSSVLTYTLRTQQPYTEFTQPSETCSGHPRDPPSVQDIGLQIDDIIEINKICEWDMRTMLSNLSFLEQKIHKLKDLVHLIVGRRGGPTMGRPDELVVQQQQLVTADLTSIIVQLISTAGSLLPSVKNSPSTAGPSLPDQQLGQLGENLLNSCLGVNAALPQPSNGGTKMPPDQPKQVDPPGHLVNEHIEDHESKEEEDADVDDGENLPLGSYEILQLEKEEILAPHTHFCTICGKGFKRDANLRMHMRGHGDKYKTPEALAKPQKDTSSEAMLVKRYSCPYIGCKRNKDHKKFQALKSILCVKNHYKRTHCHKSYTCSTCNTKKFSVIADLKTHEKHCGKDKWLCSCGTTFSRKDKLFGHITLFQGHTPAVPLDETKGQAGPSVQGETDEETQKQGSLNFDVGPEGEVQNIKEGVKGSVDDPSSYFSPLTFDSVGGFHEFARPPFENSEGAFSFLIPGSCNYTQKRGGDSSSNNLS